MSNLPEQYSKDYYYYHYHYYYVFSQILKTVVMTQWTIPLLLRLTGHAIILRIILLL